MVKQTTSEVTATLLIEGTNHQITAINRHKDKWEAAFKLNDQVIPLNEWDMKKIDGTRHALIFPLTDVGCEKFCNLSKDLIFTTGSLKANEVLTSLVTDGMKVRILTSDGEFTLKKNAISFIKKEKVIAEPQ